MINQAGLLGLEGPLIYPKLGSEREFEKVLQSILEESQRFEEIGMAVGSGRARSLVQSLAAAEDDVSCVIPSNRWQHVPSGDNEASKPLRCRG